MKHSLKIVLLLTGVLLASACSKTPGKTNSKVKIVSGNFAALLSSQANNGLFFYGKSTDGKVFTKKVDTDTIDLVFPNGTWNLYAVSYELVSPPAAGTLPNFTGKTYCGKTTTTFNGTDASIQINMSNAGCNDPEFSSYTTLVSTDYVLPTVKFFTCKDLAGITGINSTACDQNLGAKFNKGYATSYRIVAYEYANFGTITGSNKIAQSACVRADFSTLTGMLEGADSSLLSSLHVPTTPGNGLSLAVEVFYSPGVSNVGCDGTNGVDVLPLAPSPRVKAFPDASYPVTYNLFVKSDAADVCSGVRLSPNYFAGGFGTAGSPYAICTQGQMDLLRTQFATYKESSFDLLTDINYGLTRIAPIGDALTDTGTPTVSNYYGKVSAAYRPVFDGKGHKISNFIIDCKTPTGTASNNDVGFFRKLGDVEIKNLTINNGIIFCDKGNNIGVLAGSMAATNGSSFSNLKLHGHSEANQFAGGLIGYVSGSAIDLSAVHVKGDYGASAYAGGFFGSLSIASAGTIYQSSFSGSIYADKNSGGGTPNPTYAGGIAGFASSSTTLSLNQVVVKAKDISGITTVGGFFGETNNVAITDSYAESNLHASGQTDGSVSFINIGGAIGKMTGGSLNRVLALNTMIDFPGKGATDNTSGGLAGNKTSPSCTNSFHIDGTDSVCGTALLNHAQWSTQANFTSALGFIMPTKMGVWDAAATPSQSFTCTTPDNGKYYEVVSAASTPVFGSVLPGDIILCNGSTNSLVQLMNVDSVLTSSPFTWVMPDDGYDVPRLSFEAKVENDVPYLKRECHGRYTTQYGSGTATDPKWVCSYSQFIGMAGDGTNYILKNNIFMDTTDHTPLSAGVYNLDGNGLGLYGFSMSLSLPLTTNTNYGIFSKLMPTSTIRNLDVVGGSLSASFSTSSNPTVNLGFLAGLNNGVIYNVNIRHAQLSLGGATLAAGDNISLGGLVGLNSGTIRKSEADVKTIIQDAGGNYPAGANIFAGGFVGFNNGTLEGLRSHSEFIRLKNCVSSGATISLPSTEILGGFLGKNASGGVVKEVETEGEFRMDNDPAGAFFDCKYDENANLSPFIASNAGTVQDFSVRPRVWFPNTQKILHEIVAQTSGGTLSRGIVQYEARDSLAFLPGQTLINDGTWDEITDPFTGGVAPTPTCSSGQVGHYKSVSNSEGTVYNSLGAIVAVGDYVVCDGANNVVVPASLTARLTAAAPSMTDVLMVVDNPQGTCSNTKYFTQTECSSNSGTWTSGSSPILPSGRYYGDALDYSISGTGTLVVKQAGTAIPSFSGASWTVASDFFNPGTNTWLLYMPPGVTSSTKPPELVKTGGSIEQLGSPF